MLRLILLSSFVLHTETVADADAEGKHIRHPALIYHVMTADGIAHCRGVPFRYDLVRQGAAGDAESRQVSSDANRCYPILLCTYSGAVCL